MSQQLKHPNIVRLLDVIDTAKYIGIVLEFAGGGELFDYILANRYLKEKDASRLFAQLISGVDYLHQKHIVHRDLKLENLLLDKHRNIIITDFGFANRFERDEDDLMSTSCGSPCYAAPELVVTEGLYVGTAVDVWSCGVILYAMLSGYLPYDDDPANPDGDNINLLYKYIMSTPLNFPDHLSHVAKDLLLAMLVPNPQDRGTIAQIEEHLWLAPHHALFERSIEDVELIFADNMIRKSQQAKRDLATRKRLQQEARLVKALQRSQSTAPGSGMAPMLDQRRPKENRHRSALPGTTTMPDYLNNAGHHPPILEAPPAQRRYNPTEMERSGTLPTHLPAMHPPHESIPLAVPDSPTVHRSQSVKRPAEVSVEEPVIARSPPRPKTPMSANKNRHTIQVEYDSDVAWDQAQSGGAEPKRDTPTPSTPPTRALEVPQAGDMEIESSSDLDGSEPKMDISEPATPVSEVVAVVTTPRKPVPKAPSIKDAEAMPPPPVPAARSRTVSTPATPSKRAREDAEAAEVREGLNSTPKANKSTPEPSNNVDRTPRASESQNQRLPPGASTPTKQPSAPLPTIDDLPPLPPLPVVRPPATRPTRQRKGMSLDKFGLAKLLGTAPADSNSVPSRQSYVPTSKHTKAQSVSQHPGQYSYNSTIDSRKSMDSKKSRRTTLQLLSNNSRESTPESTGPPATASPQRQASLTTPVVGRQGIQPRPSQDQKSSPSVVTIDSEMQSRPASSSAAKRVMDWFRRKSLAKDTLTSIHHTSSVRGGSPSSPGRPSVSIDRPFHSVSNATTARPPRESFDQVATAGSDEASSVAPTVDTTGPAIVIIPSAKETEAEEEKADEVKEAVRSSKEEQATTATIPTASLPIRQPLAPASSKANVDTKLRVPERVAVPTRSKSQRTPHAQVPLSSSPSSNAATALVSPLTLAAGTRRWDTAGVSAEESKLRVHTGLVDQSALSSRPPPEIMAEVVRVLHEMGMDVKQEGEYRLRCTRARRRKAGPTTGLSLMGSASANKTDGRGLPLPSTASAGGISSLKGMLLRRGSSYSSQHSAAIARSESDLLTSTATTPTPGQTPSPVLGPVNEPLYGEHSIDNGDEVKFVVDLCRIKNLSGLYLLSIKRLRGSVWSFKFIYQTVVERCETLTH